MADAEDGSLADDEGFNRWIDEAGGSGIVEAYASAEGPMAMFELMEGGMASSTSSSESGEASLAGRAPAVPGELDDEQFGNDEFGMLNPLSPFGAPDDVAEAFEEFEGGAMVVRFDDGALEVEIAGGGVPSDVSGEGGSGMGDLPASTALALGIGVQRHGGRRPRRRVHRGDGRGGGRADDLDGRGDDRTLAPRGPADAPR